MKILNYNKKFFISLLIISLFVFFQIGSITTTATTLDNEEFYNSNSEDTTNAVETDQEIAAKKNVSIEEVGSSYPPVTQEGDLNNILSYKVESYYDNGKITHSNLIIYSEEQSYYDAWGISERDFKRREGFPDSLRINIPEELNVTELTFDKINYIPEFYLKNYDKITTINFKNYTELYIAKDAFAGWSNVSWLDASSYDENKNYIPVKYIGKRAFCGCFENQSNYPDYYDYIIFAETMSSEIYPENIKPLYIPKYVTYMLGNSFNMSDSIVSKQNPKYYCDGDCIFERGTNKLIHARNIGCVPDWVDTLTYGSLSYDDEKKIVIPEHITKIESSVFYKCSTWIIDLPKSLEELDVGAFYWMKNCYEINFPEKFDNTCNIVQNTIEKSEINSMNFRVPENCIITCWNFIKPYNAKEITILSDFPEMKLYNMYKIYYHIQKYSAILYGEDISGTDLELSEEEKAKRIEERSAYGNHPYYPDFFWRMPQYQQTYCYRSDESEDKYDEFYFYRYKKTNEITTINTLSTCTNIIDYCKHSSQRYAYRCLDTGEYWSPEMDFNRDSEVTIVDATTLQKYLTGFDVSNYDYNMADCDRDGHISISDVTCIQRYLAGMQ